MNNNHTTDDNQQADDSAPVDKNESRWLGQLMIELERSRAASRGLAVKPQDAMKSVWAAPLREQPWMAAAVVQVAYFARNDDFCTEDLPYERIAATLSAKGTPIPIDQRLDKAQQRKELRQRVWEALNLTRSLHPEWFHVNIEGELRRRRSETDGVSLESLESPAARSADGGQGGSAQPRLSRAIRRNIAARQNRSEQLADISLACGIAAGILADEVELEANRLGAGEESVRLLALQVAHDAARVIEASTTAPALAVTFGRPGSGLDAIREVARVAARRRSWTTSRCRDLERDASIELLRALELLPMNHGTPASPEARERGE